MKYISTRGKSAPLSFKQVLLAGLAQDGGLFVPEVWPQITQAQIASFRGMPYSQVAFHVMKGFVGGEIADDCLQSMIDVSYAEFFHPAVAPLVQTGHNSWLLELFHGPTLAFKDVAMQILSRLMQHVLDERGETMTIVGATSGDTGGAALEAFKNCTNIDTFFMFPEGKVSPVQRRQMTTVDGTSTHAIAIQGTFDDCQNIVKGMFANQSFREHVNLSAVNSINWGRVMAQTVYYFTAAASLGAPDRSVSFTVPTGNFGDIYAGYVAKKMGLPIDQLIIATNENDILNRTIATGIYKVKSVKSTITPSMDIQISSNFERLLFEAVGRKPELISEMFEKLGNSREYSIPQAAIEAIRSDFDCGTATESQTIVKMRETLVETGCLLDPHTAVAYHVASQFNSGRSPMVTLATAHPAKFPMTVENSTGVEPTPPDWVKSNENTPESVTLLENDSAAVEAFIRKRLQDRK